VLQGSRNGPVSGNDGLVYRLSGVIQGMLYVSVGWFPVIWQLSSVYPTKRRVYANFCCIEGILVLLRWKMFKVERSSSPRRSTAWPNPFELVSFTGPDLRY
jgi:hypothetical protein